jgi:hypothetical protein
LKEFEVEKIKKYFIVIYENKKRKTFIKTFKDLKLKKIIDNRNYLSTLDTKDKVVVELKS